MWQRFKLLLINFYLSIFKIIIDKFHPLVQFSLSAARPSLDDLPDLCLLAVFKNLSLLELLRSTRRVNTRWSRLASAELNLRRSLVIIDNRRFDPLDLQLDQYQSRLIELVKRDDGHTPWSRLPHIDQRNVLNRNDRYPHYDANDNRQFDFELRDQVQPEMITTLIDSLPRIISLTVVQEFFDALALEQVVRMIDHWSDQLVTLNLSLTEGFFRQQDYIPIPEHYDTQVKTQTFKLIDSLNRAAALKHLKFGLNFYRNHHISNLPPLTILSQLSSFKSGYLLRNQLHYILRRYAANNRQLQLSTGFAHDFDQFLKIDRQFCGQFVDVTVDEMLRLDRRNVDEEEEEDDDDFDDDIDNMDPMLRNMNHFCTRFTSLTHLYLKIASMPAVTRLSRPLSQLTQLTHLTMIVFFLFGNEDENPDDAIVPVPSVRLITLELRIDSHTNTERLHLPEMFPNLQVLSITNYIQYCSACELDTDGGLEEGYEQFAPELRQCAQLARQPFRACPNLHTIEIDANDSFFLSEGMSKRLITRDEL